MVRLANLSNTSKVQSLEGPEDGTNDGKLSHRHLKALGKIQCFVVFKNTGVSGKLVTKCCYAEKKIKEFKL